SFFAPYFLPPPGLSPDPYYLCIRHDECFQRQETVHGGLTFGQPYWQATAFIGNDEYTGNCIGLHPPAGGRAKAYFAIPAGARWFRSIVGLARQDTTQGNGNAVVAVDVDGQRQWTERIAGSTRAGIHVNTGNIGIPEGAKLLTLISDADGDNWNDHVLWARPAFSAQPIV
ncbi:MAG: NPCBM/NEW2 domain-containing protein, partial [Devosia sp.]|nr:NPCBM/NEW2 domain-containing protein [Devosia sp.]